MKKSKILVMLLVTFLSSSAISQKLSKVKGTIGKEKDDNMLAVCVFGTASCMPLEVDESMKTDFDGKTVNVKDLPAGLYIEAYLEKITDSKYQIKSMITDINKTVICFNEMNESDEQKLTKMLDSINAVRNYKFYKSSFQVYIEYDQKIISYSKLEKTIADAGLKLE